mgnify:CR=1 FL=1|tara:strand:- start:1 stop:615 length:615 start_codon:yes stop_codon:yes gene_type:complete
MGLISAGSTIFDAGAMSAGFGGSMVFIKKLTASSSATLSFVNGASGVVFDDTYKEYMFTFKNIHPETDSADLTFQVDTGTDTNYNQTLTSTVFRAEVREDAADAKVIYDTNLDQAQGTAFQQIQHDIGNDADQSAAGTLTLFNPASATFVKHFIARSQIYYAGDYALDFFVAGYFNTTTALTKVQFKMSTGNIDAGDICLYGIA